MRSGFRLPRALHATMRFLPCPVGSSATAHLTGSASTQSKDSQAARKQLGLIPPKGEGNLVELRAAPPSLSSGGEKRS